LTFQLYWNTGGSSSPATNHSTVVTASKLEALPGGALACHLTIRSNFSVVPTGLNSTAKYYDLNENTTYLVMATGQLLPNGKLK
jgi:hypothetical protein